MDLNEIVHKNRSCFYKIIKNKYPEIYNEIIKLDGKTFSEKLYLYNFGTKGYCTQCGKETAFVSINIGYRRFCSNRCVNNSLDIKNRIKASIIEKYGVNNVSQNIDIKAKKQKIYLEKYGVKSPLNIERIKKKRNSAILKYINDNKNKIINNLNIKRRKCFIERCKDGSRFGLEIEALFDENNFTNIKDRFLRFRCKKCGNIFHHHLQWGVIPVCWKCYPNSLFQDNIIDFIKKLNGDGGLLCNVRNEINGELDIYMPLIRVDNC